MGLCLETGWVNMLEQTLWSPSIEVAFWNFHTSHPEVYEGLVRLAYQAVNAGRERIGIGMLFEVLRWEWFITPDASEEFKLNNNYRSRYARLIMEEPGLGDVFETRRLTT